MRKTRKSMRKLLFMLCFLCSIALNMVGQTFTFKENGLKIKYQILSKTDKTVTLKEAKGSGALNVPDMVNYKGEFYTVVSIAELAASDIFGGFLVGEK